MVDKVKPRETPEEDAVFMKMALTMSQLSEDPNTQVGCVIVSPRGNVVSAGYNHKPRTDLSDGIPYEREGDMLETKYAFIVHAERDALEKFEGIAPVSLRGAKCYTTLYPCHECARSIADYGLSEVIYLSDKYFETDDRKAAQWLLKNAGVVVRHYDGRLI
jgi:dCMP deaminase